MQGVGVHPTVHLGLRVTQLLGENSLPGFKGWSTEGMTAVSYSTSSSGLNLMDNTKIDLGHSVPVTGVYSLPVSNPSLLVSVLVDQRVVRWGEGDRVGGKQVLQWCG